MHVAQKFEHLLDMYRRPDGHEWTGAQLAKATGGVVPRSYVTNLRKGRIENPGYEKMRAIAKAMGFAPEVWFEDGLGEGRAIAQAEDLRGVAGRLGHLFEVVRNPKTAEPYTNAEVYIRLAAKGQITDSELEEALAELEVTRAIAEWELSAVRARKEVLEKLEQDKDTLLDTYARMTPEALDSLTPEERRQVYTMLRLKVEIDSEGRMEARGVLSENVRVLHENGHVRDEEHLCENGLASRRQ